MKRYLFKILLCTILLVILCDASYTQQFTTGTNFLLSVPQQEYKDVVGDVGYGLASYLLYSWKNSPLKIGAQISYLILGSISDNVDVNGSRAQVKSTSNTLLVTFLGRLQRQKGFFRPYVEAVLGFQNLNSQVTTTTSISSNLRFAAFADDTQFLMTYGIGAGTWITLSKPSRIGYIGGFGKRGTFLDLRVNYLNGGKADYLEKNSITVSGDTISVGQRRVATNLLMFTLGVIFAF